MVHLFVQQHRISSQTGSSTTFNLYLVCVCVFSGCHGEWDSASCWQNAVVGEVMTLPCPSPLQHLFGKNGEFLLGVFLGQRKSWAHAAFYFWDSSSCVLGANTLWCVAFWSQLNNIKTHKSSCFNLANNKTASQPASAEKWARPPGGLNQHKSRLMTTATLTFTVKWDITESII